MTRFGEILPLLKCLSIFVGLFCICQISLSAFASFVVSRYSAQCRCCKRPNIERIRLPFGHTDDDENCLMLVRVSVLITIFQLSNFHSQHQFVSDNQFLFCPLNVIETNLMIMIGFGQFFRQLKHDFCINKPSYHIRGKRMLLVQHDNRQTMELFSRTSVSAQVISCCVYELTKQQRQCIKRNNRICLTIGQIQAFTSFYSMDRRFVRNTTTKTLNCPSRMPS